MKSLLFLLFAFLLVSCSQNSNPVNPQIVTKTDTLYVPIDSVRMQFQLNTSLVGNVSQYLIYADYDGKGYSYQPISETVFRGDYQQYYLQWYFHVSQIKISYAKFEILAHPTSGNDVVLGTVYYYK